MLNQHDIINYLRENKQYYYDNFNITKIGIFGSYARQEQNEKSDLDIIIQLPKGTENIFEKKELLRENLQNHFKIDIDICRDCAIKPLFREVILKEAIYV